MCIRLQGIRLCTDLCCMLYLYVYMWHSPAGTSTIEQAIRDGTPLGVEVRDSCLQYNMKHFCDLHLLLSGKHGN